MGVNTLRPKATLSKYWTAPNGTDLFLDDATYGLLNTGTLASDAYNQVTGVETILSVDIRRGRRNQADQLSAGTAVLVLENTAAAEDATDYAIGQYAQIIARDDTATETAVFTGVIQSATRVNNPLTSTDTITITLVDYLRELADFIPIGLQSEDHAGDTVSTRIGRVLDTLPAPPAAADRDIESTTVTVTGTAWTQNLLAEIEDAETSDGGVFYIEKDGTYKYRAYTELYKSSNYSSYIDISTANGATYPARVFSDTFSADRVINHLSYTCSDADATLVARDVGTSVTLYGRRIIAKTVTADTPADLSAARVATIVTALADQDHQLAALEVHADRGSWKTAIPLLELQTYTVRTVQGAVTNVCIVEGLEHKWDTQSGWFTSIVTNRAVPAAAS